MLIPENSTAGFQPDEEGTPGGESERYKIYIVMSYLSIFSVMGTIGNALVLYVFSKMLKQNLTSTIFILTLAGTDFVTCLVTIPFTIVMEYLEFIIRFEVPCKIYGFILSYTVMYSSLIMVAIAFDRYLCICHPFLHAMNMKRARIIVIVLAMLTFALSLVLAASNSVYVYKKIEDFNGSRITIGQFVNSSFPESNTTRWEHYYTGVCSLDRNVLGEHVYLGIKYIHNSFFVLAIVVAFVLYSLIMRRVLARTKSRRGFSIKCPCLVTKSHADTQLSPMNGESQLSSSTSQDPSLVDSGSAKPDVIQQKPLIRRGSKKSDKNLMANLKIAGTLFVVTIVFFVTFFPAWLMVTGIIDGDIILFNIYFLYNVANPIIYAFMNQNFRIHLQELFSCLKRGTGKRK